MVSVMYRFCAKTGDWVWLRMSTLSFQNPYTEEVEYIVCTNTAAKLVLSSRSYVFCVCVYVHACVCIRELLCTFVLACVCAWVQSWTIEWGCVSVCVCVCVCACVYVCSHTWECTSVWYIHVYILWLCVLQLNSLVAIIVVSQMWRWTRSLVPICLPPSQQWTMQVMSHLQPTAWHRRRHRKLETLHVTFMDRCCNNSSSSVRVMFNHVQCFW